jgi:hypothetical protein
MELTVATLSKHHSCGATIQRRNHANVPEVQRGRNDFQQAVKAERRIEMAQIELTQSEIEMLREAMREKNPQLLKLSLKGLSTSVKGFEGSYPKLVGIVNSICLTLSNIGI